MSQPVGLYVSWGADPAVLHAIVFVEAVVPILSNSLRTHYGLQNKNITISARPMKATAN